MSRVWLPNSQNTAPSRFRLRTSLSVCSASLQQCRLKPWPLPTSPTTSTPTTSPAPTATASVPGFSSSLPSAGTSSERPKEASFPTGCHHLRPRGHPSLPALSQPEEAKTFGSRGGSAWLRVSRMCRSDEFSPPIFLGVRLQYNTVIWGRCVVFATLPFPENDGAP